MNFEKYFDNRYKWAWVGGVFLVTAVIHYPFVLFDAFGEQDAARIANLAYYGKLVGKLTLFNQWAFSTPGYIHLLHLALRAELISADEIVGTMAAVSFVFSSIFSAAFMLFMNGATRSLKTACVMTLLVQLSPFYWISSLYGFPTLVALGLFMVSVVLFQAGFTQKGMAQIARMSAAVVIFFAAVLCKVDMVTATALFCLPVWQSKKTVKTKFFWTGGLCLMAVLAFGVLNRYGVVLSEYETVSQNWENWSLKFYKGVSNLFSKENFEIIGRASGVASFPLAFLAVLIVLRCKTERAILTWTLLTIFPIIVFWGMIAGNSARHNLIPSIFVTVLIALPLQFLKGVSRTVWVGMMIAACAINYFYWPPTISTVRPSGRLIQSAQKLERRLNRRTREARRIPKRPADKILVLTPTYLIPVYYFETLRAPHLEFVKLDGEKVYFKNRETGKEKMIFFPHREHHESALQLAIKEHYDVVRGW